MATAGWDVVPFYYLCAVLTFTEVAVLIASAIGVFVFVVREITGEIDRLLDTAINGRWFDTQTPSKTRDHRHYKIVGGHNERF